MLSSSFNSDKRAVDRLRKRGSLPLKKRRVTLFHHQVSSNREPQGTFLPLDPVSSKDVSSDLEPLKSVTPEPSAASATGMCVGCLSLTTSGFCNKPCFKQSSYCKMHFLRREGNLSSASGSSGGDKRFTGAKNQVRCCATTTRGRPCAYIAVGDQKYCHLHSDYDTNPAPRRDSRRGATHGSMSSLTSTSSMSSSSTTGTSPTAGNVTLLSNLPTAQWKHKSVRIALGPLTGQIGVVEKWGNGWVSCRVEGVGLHNRRAFELQLTESTDDGKASSPPPLTPNISEAKIRQVTPCSVADVTSIQVPEIRLPNNNPSKALSFRLSGRTSEAIRNPL